MAEAQTLVSGKKTLSAANTAEAITTTSTEVTAVSVKAISTNTHVMHIGPSSVGAESYGLEAKESVEFDIIDLARVFIYGEAGEGVEYLGLAP